MLEAYAVQFDKNTRATSPSIWEKIQQQQWKCEVTRHECLSGARGALHCSTPWRDNHNITGSYVCFKFGNACLWWVFLVLISFDGSLFPTVYQDSRIDPKRTKLTSDSSM
jgi:hypothetical protein